MYNNCRKTVKKKKTCTYFTEKLHKLCKSLFHKPSEKPAFPQLKTANKPQKIRKNSGFLKLPFCFFLSRRVSGHQRLLRNAFFSQFVRCKTAGLAHFLHVAKTKWRPALRRVPIGLYRYSSPPFIHWLHTRTGWSQPLRGTGLQLGEQPSHTP